MTKILNFIKSSILSDQRWTIWSTIVIPPPKIEQSLCDVSMKLRSRRLKRRRMDHAWASSLEGWRTIPAATCQSLSKRHQSTRTRTKIRDRGQLRRTTFQRGGIESATDPIRSSLSSTLVLIPLVERC